MFLELIWEWHWAGFLFSLLLSFPSLLFAFIIADQNQDQVERDRNRKD